MASQKYEPQLSVGVSIGANSGNDVKYENLARNIAQMFSTNHWKLVYGGSSRGLMGIMARNLHASGGHVHGVNPRPFLQFEPGAQPSSFGTQELVDDLHSQKRRMAELVDAFVVFPGGFGTLEELVTTRMWVKLSVLKTPIVIGNIWGFFDPLVAWIHDTADKGFISQRGVTGFTVFDDLAHLPDALQSMMTALQDTTLTSEYWSRASTHNFFQISHPRNNLDITLSIP